MKLIQKGLIFLIAGCVLAIISILSVAANTDDRAKFAKLIEPGETATVDNHLDKSTSRN